jgi:hypothetical protein
MKELELIDYTGNMFGSHFIYILPGEYQPGTQYAIKIERLPMGKVRIASVTRIPFSKLTETVARLFMGKPLTDVKKIMGNTYRLKDDDIVSIIAFEWTNIDNDGLKAMMEVRFDGMKGLSKYERSLQLNLL